MQLVQNMLWSSVTANTHKQTTLETFKGLFIFTVNVTNEVYDHHYTSSTALIQPSFSGLFVT